MKKTVFLFTLFLISFTGELRSVDFDRDGIPDPNDNCPWNYNPTQTDIDTDGVGDICDSCPFPTDTEQTNFTYRPIITFIEQTYSEDCNIPNFDGWDSVNSEDYAIFATYWKQRDLEENVTGNYFTAFNDPS
jgi:hypothetical protein